MSNIVYRFKQLNTAEQLIIFNIGVFLISLILSGANIQYIRFMGVSNHISEVITFPWTLLSYAFLHNNFSHIFWNMLLLYFTGSIFFNLLNRNLFLKIYTLGTLGGAFLYLIINHFVFPTSQNMYLIGASASIISILAFLCAYVPHYKVTLPFNIRLDIWIFGLIVIGIDLIQVPSGNAGGHIAHLGGALVGLFYALSIKRGKRIRKVRFFKEEKKQSSSNTRKKMSPKEIHQRQIDHILDKINKSGYESLSKAEKEYLFKAKQ